eukprot:1363984-Rhodomonas_salina.1
MRCGVLRRACRALPLSAHTPCSSVGRAVGVMTSILIHSQHTQLSPRNLLIHSGLGVRKANRREQRTWGAQSK